MKAMGPEEACFFTQQVYLIGTEDEDTSPRFAPISWVSYSWGSPACLVISIYGTKQTKKYIARTKQLTAAVVTEDMLPFIDRPIGKKPWKVFMSILSRLKQCRRLCSPMENLPMNAKLLTRLNWERQRLILRKSIKYALPMRYLHLIFLI